MAAGISELRIEKVGDSIALVRTKDGEVRSEFILSPGEVQGLAQIWPGIARDVVPIATLKSEHDVAYRLQ